MLLEWVHRKFRQNNRNPVKDSPLGSACICFLGKPLVDNEESQIKPSFSTRNGPKSLKQSQPSNPESYLRLGNGKETCQEEIRDVSSDLFHGFLTIGTLGAETIENEPATPTFATPLENITEGKDMLTNDDLKLIHNELEKLLQEETKVEGSYESSGRNSCVSTITLSCKQVEGDEAEDSRNSAACPLQGYLFAASIGELPQRRTEVKKEKATLGELFQRTKIYETAEGEAQMRKLQTPARPAMRKMMKKLHGYWKHPTPIDNGTDTDSTNKKPFKVLRMLQRKIYPETRASAKECNTFHRNKINDVLSSSSHGHTTGVLTRVDEACRLPTEYMPNKWKQNSKINLNQPRNAHNENNSCGNREHWIKTDADYLVLELKQPKQ